METTHLPGQWTAIIQLESLIPIIGSREMFKSNLGLGLGSAKKSDLNAYLKTLEKKNKEVQRKFSATDVDIKEDAEKLKHESEEDSDLLSIQKEFEDEFDSPFIKKNIERRQSAIDEVCMNCTYICTETWLVVSIELFIDPGRECCPILQLPGRPQDCLDCGCWHCSQLLHEVRQEVAGRGQRQGGDRHGVRARHHRGELRCQPGQDRRGAGEEDIHPAAAEAAVLLRVSQDDRPDPESPGQVRQVRVEAQGQRGWPARECLAPWHWPHPNTHSDPLGDVRGLPVPEVSAV